jgi:hypothetical protein
MSRGQAVVGVSHAEEADQTLQYLPVVRHGLKNGEVSASGDTHDSKELGRSLVGIGIVWVDQR